MGRLRRITSSSSYIESDWSSNDDLTNNTTCDSTVLDKLLRDDDNDNDDLLGKSSDINENELDKTTPRMEDLLTTLSLLGQEPIFSSLWRLDLLEMPDEYFISCEEEYDMRLSDGESRDIPSVRMLISSVHRDSVPYQIRGIRAFKQLLGIGSGMRERGVLQAEWGRKIGSSTDFACRTIRSFITWINKDITVLEKDVRDYLVITTEYSSLDIWHKLTEAMHWQARQTSGKIKERGPNVVLKETAIYGVGICGNVFFLVAAGIGEQIPPLRTIGILDFTDRDLWNAVSLAMHILTAREEAISIWYMMQ